MFKFLLSEKINLEYLSMAKQKPMRNSCSLVYTSKADVWLYSWYKTAELVPGPADVVRSRLFKVTPSEMLGIEFESAYVEIVQKTPHRCVIQYNCCDVCCDVSISITTLCLLIYTYWYIIIYYIIYTHRYSICLTLVACSLEKPSFQRIYLLFHKVV